MKTQTHYATLGLAPNATSEVIRAAYNALTATYDPGETTKISAALYTEVQEAFDVLDNESMKADYNAELARSEVEVVDEVSAFHHRPLVRCTTVTLTTREQTDLMRIQVRAQVQYWQWLRQKRREAETCLSVTELESLVEIWGFLEDEHAADPAMKARCAILAHEYSEELNVRSRAHEERPDETSTARDTPVTPTKPVAEEYRAKTPTTPTKSAIAASASLLNVTAQHTRLDTSPTPAPFPRVSARAAERKQAEEKRAVEAKARAEARMERKAQMEAAKKAVIAKKAAMVRASKAEQKAILDEQAREKAEHIAKVRAKVRGGPIGITDVDGDGVASGEKDGTLSHGIEDSNEGM